MRHARPPSRPVWRRLFFARWDRADAAASASEGRESERRARLRPQIRRIVSWPVRVHIRRSRPNHHVRYGRAEIHERDRHHYRTTGVRGRRPAQVVEQGAPRHVPAACHRRGRAQQPYDLLPIPPVHVLSRNDGGGAFILTSADRVDDYPTKPVYILGTGESVETAVVSQMYDMTTSAAFKTSGAKAFEEGAGLPRRH